MIVRALRSEELDLSYIKSDPGAPTGVFFKWRSGGKSKVLYYRKDSAACRLGVADVPDEAFDGIELVHLTGITMAISHGARDLVIDTARRARERGAIVTFDPNYRPTLWTSSDDALAAQRDIFPFVDWYLCGVEEGNALFGTISPEDLFAALNENSLTRACIRIGRRGALVRDSSGIVTVPPSRVEAVLDEIGAGDGFAAGFAYGLLDGRGPAECTRAGNLIAAAALRGTGDWETFPRLQEVEQDLKQTHG